MITESDKPHDIIQQSILEEYPVLNGSQMNIKTRFQSSDRSRFYNTYLVESSLEGFEKFVAKGSANAKFRQKELGTEWRALNLLQSPALLLPDHMPQTFLLLEYIEGRTAAEMVLSGEDRAETFYQSGRAARRVHSIAVPSFGSLSSPSNADWKAYFDSNMQERFEIGRAH